MKSNPSPIKIKDFFTNPLHKVKQPAFVQVGFNHSNLITFIKTFTNKNNTKYINLSLIKNFIKNFTNNNPKLMQTYQQFFDKNFLLKQSNMIDIEYFIQFFLKEEKYNLQQLSQKGLKNIYNNISPLNVQGLISKGQQLGISLDQKQAKNIIIMINLKVGSKNRNEISQEDFLYLMKKTQQN